MEIKKQYHDALYFAVAKINKKAKFALTPIQKSIIEKMIHYEKTYPQITFSNATIAEHLFCSELTIKDAIEDLYRKGYLISVTEFHTNYGSPAKSRIITIKWDKLQEVLDMIPTKEEIKLSKEVKVKIKNKMEKKQSKEIALELEVITNQITIHQQIVEEELKTEIKEKTFMDEFKESESDEQIIENVIEEPIQELTSLFELQYDEMITLAVIESDEMLTDIFKEDVKLSFDMIRTIAKNNELNQETKQVLFDTFDGIILSTKRYMNKYLEFGGVKINNELINK